MMEKSVAIIGAGSVGTNAAIFLRKLGIEVYLFDSQSDILGGAPAASFINHGDGFEYYKSGHQATGKYCIDGSLVKGLLYPINCFRTNVVTETNPIRFFVSQNSSDAHVTPLNDFYENAKYMQNHFSLQFEAIKNAKGWSYQQTNDAFLRSPDSFYRILEPSDYEDVTQIAGGCSGSSFGINMPHYFAFLKAAMKETGVVFYGNAKINYLEKQGEKYLIHSNQQSIAVSYVIVTANHHIPSLDKTSRNIQFKYKSSGTYYLNSMTFLELPPTADQKKISDVNHINFTLQGDNGSMFACLVPPTYSESGLAVTYFPSVQGSQLHNNIYDKDHPITNPSEWDDLIRYGLISSDEAVQNTLQQAYRFYPFLKNYAELKKTICRPVFNVSVQDSPKGIDRRVREILDKPIMLSDNERVSMWTSPKWTNAELVALMATDHICKQMGLPELPKRGSTSLGPTYLDVAEISNTINFFDLKMRVEDAYIFSRNLNLPDRIVDLKCPAFY